MSEFINHCSGSADLSAQGRSGRLVDLGLYKFNKIVADSLSCQAFLTPVPQFMRLEVVFSAA